MEHDERYLRLVAVGASVAANCQPCLQVNVTRALECGASQAEIAEAIQVGRMVRKGAASKMDEFAASLSRQAASPAASAVSECGCVTEEIEPCT